MPMTEEQRELHKYQDMSDNLGERLSKCKHYREAAVNLVTQFVRDYRDNVVARQETLEQAAELLEDLENEGIRTYETDE